MTDSDLCSRGSLRQRDNWRARLQAADATAARVGDAPTLWGPRVFSAISQRLVRPDYYGMERRWHNSAFWRRRILALEQALM